MDARDSEILRVRAAAFLARQQVKQGDFIRFANGTIRRVSHVWTDENNQPDGVQTTMKDTGGSFYLGDGYMSYSGGMWPSIPANTLTRAVELMDGRAWFFHHDYSQAHNGIDVNIPCPVWDCTLEANQ
jgi:hypothetical protein